MDMCHFIYIKNKYTPYNLSVSQLISTGKNRIHILGDIYGGMFHENYRVRIRDASGRISTKLMEFSRFCDRRNRPFVNSSVNIYEGRLRCEGTPSIQGAPAPATRVRSAQPPSGVELHSQGNGASLPHCFTRRVRHHHLCHYRSRTVLW